MEYENETVYYTGNHERLQHNGLTKAMLTNLVLHPKSGLDGPAFTVSASLFLAKNPEDKRNLSISGLIAHARWTDYFTGKD